MDRAVHMRVFRFDVVRFIVFNAACQREEVLILLENTVNERKLLDIREDESNKKNEDDHKR